MKQKGQKSELYGLLTNPRSHLMYTNRSDLDVAMQVLLWCAEMTSIETATGQSHKATNVSSTTSKIQNSGLSFKRWGRKSPFIRYGLPMISLVVFGAVGFGHLLQGRLVLLLL